MAIRSAAVTVGTTPTRLDSTTDTDDSITGQSLTFHNGSAVTVFIGGSNVTTANGTPVAANSWSPGIDLHGGDALYGVVATGTNEVRVLEVGV